MRFCTIPQEVPISLWNSTLPAIVIMNLRKFSGFPQSFLAFLSSSCVLMLMWTYGLNPLVIINIAYKRKILFSIPWITVNPRNNLDSALLHLGHVLNSNKIQYKKRTPRVNSGVFDPLRIICGTKTQPLLRFAPLRSCLGFQWNREYTKRAIGK